MTSVEVPAESKLRRRARLAENKNVTGHGDESDEVIEWFNAAAIRIASHGPEPTEEDDLPGYWLAARLGPFLYPTEADTLAGIGYESVALGSGLRLAHSRRGHYTGFVPFRGWHKEAR